MAWACVPNSPVVSHRLCGDMVYSGAAWHRERVVCYRRRYKPRAKITAANRTAHVGSGTAAWAVGTVP